jgi:Family of unknown function (DUF6412)
MLTTLLQPAFPAFDSGLTLVAFTAVLAAGLLVALLTARAVGVQLVLATSPALSRATPLRERSRGAAYLRLRAPDAPGRPRPRAPGLRSPAA